MRAFLHSLETAPEFVVIDNVALTESNDAGDRVELALAAVHLLPERRPMNGLLRREVLIPVLVVLLGGGAYVTQPWADAPAPAQRAGAGGRGSGRTERRTGGRHPARPADGGRRRRPQRVAQSVPLPGARGAGRAAAARPVARRAPSSWRRRCPPARRRRRRLPLRFIGLIEAPPRTGRVALLSDGRGGLMYGREGDTVDGRYRMLRVGTDSIEMAYVDGRGRQTIRLSGQ